MVWFGLLKLFAELSILITRRLENKSLMDAGAAKAHRAIYKEQLIRIHNAKEAYDSTPLDADSLSNDSANRD